MSVPETGAPASLEPVEPTPAAVGDGAGRSVFYSLLSLVSSGVFTAILTLYLVRALGPASYGDFALVVGVGTLVSLPADFGVSSSAARFVAEHRAHPGRLPVILADAVRIKVIASAAACGALAALAQPIADAYHAPLAGPLRIMAVAILGQNFMFLFEGAFVASGRMATYVWVSFGESAVECSASILIVVLAGGVMGATVGRTIGYVFGGLLAAWFGARAFRWPLAMRRYGRRSITGRIARYAAPLMLVDGATVLFSMIDVLLIGAFLGSRQTGLFSAPIRLLPFLFYPANAVSRGIGPRMARGSSGPDARAMSGGLRGLVLFYSLLLAPLIVWTEPIVHILLGHRYGGSVSTMRLLSVVLYLGGIAPLVSGSANYLGEARSRVPIMIGAALLDGGIDIVLIPRIGIISGAIATAAAYLVMDIGHFAICGRHVKIPYSRLGATAARGLAAAMAMAMMMLLIGTNPTLPVFIVGLVIGTIIFVAVLILTRELSEAELAQVVGAIQSRIPGLSSRGR